MDAEHVRLTQAGLAPVDERDTTCCYARQDKFWVQGAPNGERWEVYTVLEDSQTFWGRDGGQAPEYCGDRQETDGPQAGACCA